MAPDCTRARWSFLVISIILQSHVNLFTRQRTMHVFNCVNEVLDCADLLDGDVHITVAWPTTPASLFIHSVKQGDDRLLEFTIGWTNCHFRFSCCVLRRLISSTRTTHLCLWNILPPPRRNPVQCNNNVYRNGPLSFIDLHGMSSWQNTVSKASISLQFVKTLCCVVSQQL